MLRPWNACPLYGELTARRNETPAFRARVAAPAGAEACVALGLASGCTNAQLIAEIAERTGEPELSEADIWRVADTLFCRKVHDKALPEWYSPPVQAQLDRLNAWDMYNEFAGVAVRRITGGPFLRTVLDNAAGRLNSSDCRGDWRTLPEGPRPCDRRLLLYSAHDTTLAAVLSALDPAYFGLEETPPYASALLVELWAAADGSAPELRLKLQTLFSTVPGTPPMRNLTVPGCEHRCPVGQFAALLADVIPSSMADLEAQCGTAAAPAHSGADAGGPAAFTLLGLLLGALAMAAAGWGCGFRRFGATGGATPHTQFTNHLWLDNDGEDDLDDPDA